MIDILNLTYEELETFLTKDLGEPKFRTQQVWQWLWARYVHDFESMTNLSKATRARLQECAEIVWPDVLTQQTSKDGTVKFLLRLRDGALVETVLIPGSQGRMTQCVSCQVGCAMACTFCATGTLGFERNMTMSEIMGQVLVARNFLQDVAEKPILRNIVFMGMGEPMLNNVEVMRALHTLNHPQGMQFSPRRITVSTCGINPAALREFGDSGQAYLAVSLHAPTQELRARIMPKASNWKLDDLISTLENYPLKTREHVTFEYLLLGGVNDSEEHAKQLVRLISRMKAKLNLIVYNPSGDGNDPYEAPSEDRVLAFEKYLWSKNVTAIIRKSKGSDIKAACGQLKASEQQKMQENA